MDALSTWILGGLATLIVLRVFASPSDEVIRAIPSEDGSVSGSSYIPTASANARAVSAARALAGRNLSGAKPGAAPTIWNPNAGAPVLAPAGHIVVAGPAFSFHSSPAASAPVASSPTASSPAASSGDLAPTTAQFTTQPLPVDSAPVIFSDTAIVSPVDATTVPIDVTPVDTQNDRLV